MTPPLNRSGFSGDGRWANAREILRDIGVTFGFWGLLLAVVWILDRVVGPGGGKSLEILLPRTPAEVAVWMLTSASAGFCEEIVFRGYVQRQLQALTRLGWPAVLGQGILFGLMHAYQGWRPVLRIGVLGVLFGVLAVWRKTLRPGMIAHGWQDLWAGWLSGAIRSDLTANGPEAAASIGQQRGDIAFGASAGENTSRIARETRITSPESSAIPIVIQ